MEVLARFYEAEVRYMSGVDSGFGGMAATLSPDVVLHQSPDVPWGGEYRGLTGYEAWARQMKGAFEALEVREPHFLVDGDTVVILCRLWTRSRVKQVEMEHPMAQVVRVEGGRITEFRPFYWNVPDYRVAAGLNGDYAVA